MEIPDVPKPLLEALTEAAAGERCALVGGVVRDLLLHRHHEDPWRGLPDLDIVFEGRAADLVQRLPDALQNHFGVAVPLKIKEHCAFGTFELELDLFNQSGGIWLLDIASARQEIYPEPAKNPKVRLANLMADLARRDFTVNAMALELGRFELLDPFEGARDLASRQLSFLHDDSVRDDPTRVIRAARYCARLDLSLSVSGLAQVQHTVTAWPWKWRIGDDPSKAPPALGTRMAMELRLLLTCDQWRLAIELLQGWGALSIIDTRLQIDYQLTQRLIWARRLGVPLLLALVSRTDDPINLSERLQMPHSERNLLRKLLEIESILKNPSLCCRDRPPSWWCEIIESSGVSPATALLGVVRGSANWPRLYRWATRWHKQSSPLSANDLIRENNGLSGREIGKLLKAARYQFLDRNWH